MIDYEYAKKFNKLSGIVKYYIKIDRGMNRYWQNLDDFEHIKEIYTTSKNLKIIGIFSHLCSDWEFGEESYDFTRKQIINFYKIIEALEKDKCRIKTYCEFTLNFKIQR